MFLSGDQARFLKEVYGVSSFIKEETSSTAILFVLPGELSVAGQNLLVKIMAAFSPAAVQELRWSTTQDFAQVSEKLKKLKPQFCLLFGETQFAQIKLEKNEFFEHFDQPLVWAGVETFTTHDIEKMCGDEKLVMPLKKHLWQQIKKIKEKLKI